MQYLNVRYSLIESFFGVVRWWDGNEREGRDSPSSMHEERGKGKGGDDAALTFREEEEETVGKEKQSGQVRGEITVKGRKYV